MKTRSRKPASAAKVKAKDNSEQASVSDTKLQPSIDNPPLVAILPRSSNSSSRIITIPTCVRAGHLKATRYFVDPEKGFYEFTKVVSTDSKTRSWLLAPTGVASNDAPLSTPHGSDQDSIVPPPENSVHEEGGFLLSDPSLLVATPLDPIFVILAIDGAVYPAKDGHGRSVYSTMENRIWELKQRAPQLRAVLDRYPRCRIQQRIEDRIRSISDRDPNGCDGVEYCFSIARLACELLKIAKRMVHAGLPKSLEDRFVRQTLDVPEQTLKREDSLVSIVADERQAQADEQHCKEQPSRTKTDDAVHLLRIRVALHFLLSKYTPVELSKEVQTYLDDTESGEVDFRPLDLQLAQVAKLKSEAQALQSISDNISRKRGTIEDEESMEKYEAKKRKKDEEEAKKKNMSQGVKKLMRADTSGMKKLSSFFTKAPPDKKV